MFRRSLQLVRSGVGVAFPCAAVAIGREYDVYVRDFFGHRQLQPSVQGITLDTLFDLASLSKLVATTMLAMKLFDEGIISPDDNIGKYLEYTGNYGDCNIRHLMTHTSGMPAGMPLFSMEHKSGDALNSVFASQKQYPSGKRVVYSCMGYIVLQRILERAGGDSLDKLAEKYVFSPLGMRTACFNPDSLKIVAATEKYPHNGEWATGHVHDENAHFLGGVAGNAGVFASLDDMIKFAAMCSSKGITAEGEKFISRDIFELAIKNHTPGKEESRGLGFQLKGDRLCPVGDLFSFGSYGHTGFTGTSLYVDNDTGLWGVLLTNAVHYGRENRGEYFSLRRAFYDMIITEYKKSGELVL